MPPLNGTQSAVAPRRRIFKPRRWSHKRGKLVQIEGLDGCGKTTIVGALRERLEARGQPTIVSNWNDTAEVYNLMMRLNLAGDLDGKMRCIFGAAELAARYHYVILPALEQGKLVFATKYLLSAMAHSLIRGQDADFVSRAYGFALHPELCIYIQVPPEIALERKRRCGAIGFWEAGLDLALDLPLEESLRRYQAGELDEEFVARCFLAFQSSLGRLHETLMSPETVIRVDGRLPPQAALVEAGKALDRLVFDHRETRNRMW